MRSKRKKKKNLDPETRIRLKMEKDLHEEKEIIRLTEKLSSTSAAMHKLTVETKRTQQLVRTRNAEDEAVMKNINYKINGNNNYRLKLLREQRALENETIELEEILNDIIEQQRLHTEGRESLIIQFHNDLEEINRVANSINNTCYETRETLHNIEKKKILLSQLNDELLKQKKHKSLLVMNEDTDSLIPLLLNMMQANPHLPLVQKECAIGMRNIISYSKEWKWGDMYHHKSYNNSRLNAKNKRKTNRNNKNKKFQEYDINGSILDIALRNLMHNSTDAGMQAPLIRLICTVISKDPYTRRTIQLHNKITSDIFKRCLDSIQVNIGGPIVVHNCCQLFKILIELHQSSMTSREISETNTISNIVPIRNKNGKEGKWWIRNLLLTLYEVVACIDKNFIEKHIWAKIISIILQHLSCLNPPPTTTPIPARNSMDLDGYQYNNERNITVNDFSFSHTIKSIHLDRILFDVDTLATTSATTSQYILKLWTWIAHIVSLIEDKSNSNYSVGPDGDNITQLNISDTDEMIFIENCLKNVYVLLQSRLFVNLRATSNDKDYNKKLGIKIEAMINKSYETLKKIELKFSTNTSTNFIGIPKLKYNCGEVINLIENSRRIAILPKITL